MKQGLNQTFCKRSRLSLDLVTGQLWREYSQKHELPQLQQEQHQSPHWRKTKAADVTNQPRNFEGASEKRGVVPHVGSNSHGSSTGNSTCSQNPARRDRGMRNVERKNEEEKDEPNIKSDASMAPKDETIRAWRTT